MNDAGTTPARLRLLRMLVIAGPNLNLLGQREPETYGRLTLDAIHARLQHHASGLDCEIVPFQSNHEGALIDMMHAHVDDADGAILNAGAYTHTSVALHDAVRAVPYPVVEVHLSNIHAREEFRHHSFISPVARGVIVGLGWYGYIAALETLVRLARDTEAVHKHP